MKHSVISFFKSGISLSLLLFFFSSCKVETPPSMLFGQWKVLSIKENGHEVTGNYMDDNTRYLILNENGKFRVGLIDTSSHKHWMVYPEANELILLDGSPFSDVKRWKVVASDEHLKLTDKFGHFQVELGRVSQLPEINFKSEEALLGRWIVDKVTVNGYDNTDKYAYPMRWILLAKDGYFYNGNKTGDQNMGYWNTNETMTKVSFFSAPSKEVPFIVFNIGKDRIWYQKQSDKDYGPQVRIYFRKESS